MEKMKSGKVKGKNIKVRRLIFAIVGIALLVTLITPATVLADDPDSEHYRVRPVTLADGTSIDEVVINGPPTPPLGYERATAELPEPNPEAGLNVLSDVPAFDWSFGCSATSAAMIAGYYDRTGYANIYAGPTNGGVMPMNNSVWPDWVDLHGDTRHQCPLSATHNGLDGRTTLGHVDDYWIYYGQPGPDPWDENWAEHTLGDCTGDFMRTNQWVWVSPPDSFNTDGGTTFYYYTDGAPTPAGVLEDAGPPSSYDGGAVGLKLFYESRGYTVDTAYNQYIYGYKGNTQGFTYAQYKAEIDAGRPVMIHVIGHTMVGFGYDDASNLMYIHDTWDYNTYTMTWGGTYHSMLHYGVTIAQLQPLPVITSCDASGNETNQFTPNQSVYVKGSGLELNTAYNIWIQNDPVAEGETLATGEDPSGAQETVTTGPSNGNPLGGFPATEIWPIPQSEPVTHLPYDIVVDKIGGGKGTYSSTNDGIDSATVAGMVAPVPELPTIILFSIGLLVLAGYIQLRRKDR